MSKKLIFLDIDGTIYNHEKEVPESTLEAIRLLKEKGHTLAIASGRAPFTLTEVMEETGIHNFVAFNGQYAVIDEQVIFRNPLDTEALKQLEQDAENNGHPLVFISQDEFVSNIPHHDHIEASLKTIKQDHPRFDTEFYEQNDIYQTLLFHDENEDRLYEGKYEQLKFIRWHDVSRDVIPSNGSKLEGIKKIADHLNIPLSDCVAAGDGNNDLEMIEGVGTGIAMGNAVQLLKEVADYVTDDVDDDGLYKAFKHLNMI